MDPARRTIPRPKPASAWVVETVGGTTAFWRASSAGPSAEATPVEAVSRGQVPVSGQLSEVTEQKTSR